MKRNEFREVMFDYINDIIHTYYGEYNNQYLTTDIIYNNILNDKYCENCKRYLLKETDSKYRFHIFLIEIIKHIDNNEFYIIEYDNKEIINVLEVYKNYKRYKSLNLLL